MHPELLEGMRVQVRAIYRTVTGNELPTMQIAADEREAPIEEVARSFAELEALVRASPELAQRVPSFSFAPALDAFIVGSDLVVEVAVPGVKRKHLRVEIADGTVIVSGVRRGPPLTASHAHAEIPSGPFLRSFTPSFPTSGTPSIELHRGLLRVRLKCSFETQQQEEPSRSP